MDFYYDVDAFISALAPMVSIVRRLPPALEAFARDEAVQEVDFLNPLLRSRELQRLAEHFHQHNALRLRSPARAVVWNTPRPHSHRHAHSRPHSHAHPHPNPNPDPTPTPTPNPNPNPHPNQVWNTPRLARLRVLLHSALQPSPRVALYTDHIIKSMGKFAASKGMASGAYVALQLPHGEEWCVT